MGENAKGRFGRPVQRLRNLRAVSVYSVYLRTEVGDVRRRWVLVGSALVMVLVLTAVAASAATTLFGTRYRVGETITFEVQDSTTWWWGCCSCEATMVLGWRIVDSAGLTAYSVVHDAPVSAAVWRGSWTQIRTDGTSVSTGQYVLYVDTSLGTLSRCLTIYDPCACYTPCYACTSCGCQQVSSITNCACKASLVLGDTCTSCTSVFPFFGIFGGCCSSCSGCWSSCCGCSSSP
jgi:hypothetical protein